MKRSAASSFVESRSQASKRVYDTGAVQVIHGRIEAMTFPTLPENYDGFFVGMIGGRKVIGGLPFVDWHFIYHLRCVPERGRFGDSQWKIVDFEKPAFEPVPLSFPLLKLLLVDMGGFSEHQASDAVESLRSRIQDDIPDKQNINPEQLMRLAAPVPSWLQALAERSMLFKYSAMKNLTFYWSTEALSRLKMEELAELSTAVEQDIARFCFRTTGMFSLPEVSIRNAEVFYAMNRRTAPDWLKDQCRFYTEMKAFTEKTKQLAIAPEQVVSEWRCGRGMASALKQGVARIVPLLDIDGVSYPRLMMDDHARDLQYVADRLNSLMCRPVDALKPLSSARVSLDGLTEEQTAAVQSIFSANLLIVTVVAGSGKTTKVS
jgi:hypothetical protein